ncbi:F-box/FBD/LRR protein [Rhynchospora pubera]|uniref:F-box/FBD/LRR protein n=1 Tax=Rhynchospora pubera TaxID=906938 RepID=A0AAV8DCA2_9POAL|nr:F-box/FBD/LRR protein [Rhynchospora pubera]
MAEEFKVDRISFLPEDIKISILSRLEVKDAVRTSVLTRSWRHTWTLLPSLRLGRYLDPLGDTSKNFDSRPVSSTWIKRVRSLVSSLRGPLIHFQLSLRLDTDPSNLLRRLLDLLLKKGGVQTLDLCFYYSDKLTQPVPFFFNLPRNVPVPLRLHSYHSRKVKVWLPPFHSLKVLQLEGCQLILPNEFQGFHSLTTLSLSNVIISNLHLHLLLDTSKNLTTFKFVAGDLDLVPDLSLNISLPLLTNVEFGINEMVDKICLVSTPRLEQAYIYLTSIDSGSEKLARATLGLLTSVSMVSSLHLDCDVLETLSLLALPFSFSFPQLKCLRFFLNVDTFDKRTCDVFHWLLRSMPFLEELHLKLLSFSQQTEGVATLMRELLVKKQNGISCLDQSLKRVTLSMYLLLKVMTGITVVKFFLLNAKVLKLMKIIYSDVYSDDDDALSMKEELKKVGVASSDAKVVMFNITTEVTVNVK